MQVITYKQLLEKSEVRRFHKDAVLLYLDDSFQREQDIEIIVNDDLTVSDWVQPDGCINFMPKHLLEEFLREEEESDDDSDDNYYDYYDDFCLAIATKGPLAPWGTLGDRK